MVGRVSLASFLTLAIAAAARGQEAVNLDFVASDAASQLDYYMPRQIQLTPTKPDSIKKLPADLQSPMFGVMHFRSASGPSGVAVIVDAPPGQPAKLYIDSNGNGDLTDDPAPASKNRGPILNFWTASIPIGTAEHPMQAQVCFYRSHDDPSREQLKDSLFFYRDYARFGTITLAGQSYKAALVDDFCTGDFRGDSAPADLAGKASGIYLLIDTNGDGKFEDHPGKEFDVRKPFNIHGVTYELHNLTADGQFSIARSNASVAEIAPPPNLNAGQPAPAFDALAMDGKVIHFPSDYKGKLVMLDFWATWCGPCMGEVPGLVAAYQQFHGQGFDVLGISLDQPDSADKVNTVMQQHGMVWPEIYDGKGWESSVGQQYGIRSIPHPVLVDGDTGKIITSKQRNLRGEALSPTLEKALKNPSAVSKTEN